MSEKKIDIDPHIGQVWTCFNNFPLTENNVMPVWSIIGQSLSWSTFVSCIVVNLCVLAVAK